MIFSFAVVAFTLTLLVGFIIFSYIRFKKSLTSYTPSVSEIFDKKRKKELILVMLASIVILSVTYLILSRFNLLFLDKNIQPFLILAILPLITSLCALHNLIHIQKSLLGIESYCYNHHSSNLEYQAKIDYNKLEKKKLIITLGYIFVWIAFLLLHITMKN